MAPPSLPFSSLYLASSCCLTSSIGFMYVILFLREFEGGLWKNCFHPKPGADQSNTQKPNGSQGRAAWPAIGSGFCAGEIVKHISWTMLEAADKGFSLQWHLQSLWDPAGKSKKSAWEYVVSCRGECESIYRMKSRCLNVFIAISYIRLSLHYYYNTGLWPTSTFTFMKWLLSPVVRILRNDMYDCLWKEGSR